MNKFYNRFVDGPPAFGLLLLRVVAGLALMAHSWEKIHHPFNWMPGNKVPGALQALAALGEFGGGLGLALGFLTPLAALGVLCTMCGAWVLVHRGQPWVNPGGKSFELPSLYALIAITLILTGPGKISLDSFLFGGKK